MLQLGMLMNGNGQSKERLFFNIQNASADTDLVTNRSSIIKGVSFIAYNISKIEMLKNDDKLFVLFH
jgi:diacylglycerol kinase family enzyme